MLLQVPGNVSLTVTDSQGATNGITKSVTVGTSACTGTTINGSFTGATGQSQIQPVVASINPLYQGLIKRA